MTEKLLNTRPDIKLSWLNEFSQQFLERGYLLEGVTAEDRLWEIALYAESLLDIKGFASKFYTYLAKGYYSLSTPIWTNFGLDRGLPISCFSVDIGDSMSQILYAQAEVGMMSKYGGGTGAYFGHLRKRGAPIRNNGVSSGSVHFMQLFEGLLNVVSQGCYDDQTEVLTDQGFVPFETVINDHSIKVAQVEDSGAVSFVVPTDRMKFIPEDKELLHFNREDTVDLLVTKNHNMVYKQRTQTGLYNTIIQPADSDIPADAFFSVVLSDGSQESTLKGFSTVLTVDGVNVDKVHYEGYVYCVEVPSHMLIVRRKGLAVVCGNSTRRGSFAAYLPIEHPDINEFLDIGTEGNSIQVMTTAVTVTDKFMQDMIAGNKTKRKVWAKVLQRRSEMGYPYIFFTDTVNRNTVDVYKDKKMPIRHSNLCAEILLPTDNDHSFVCDLSSMNLLTYDDWKSTDAVETMTFFLDAVMTDFIHKLERLSDSKSAADNEGFYFMRRAYNFAVTHRALGLGVFGWHSLLQSKMIPFASLDAKRLNAEIFELIQDRALAASKQMAELYGEPLLLKGYGRRNTTLTAIAPTTSSAFIIGQTSQSIEPIWSNCYVKDLAKLKVTIKNPQLERLLEERGKNTREVWLSIVEADGSVQHLDFLTEHEREVFKTFCETDQAAIIDQAATRQYSIDQGQSLNLMINPKTPAKDVNSLMLLAWEAGIKTLYYQHSTNAAQDFSRSKMCVGACEA